MLMVLSLWFWSDAGNNNGDGVGNDDGIDGNPISESRAE